VSDLGSFLKLALDVCKFQSYSPAGLPLEMCVRTIQYELGGPSGMFGRPEK